MVTRPLAAMEGTLRQRIGAGLPTLTGPHVSPLQVAPGWRPRPHARGAPAPLAAQSVARRGSGRYSVLCNWSRHAREETQREGSGAPMLHVAAGSVRAWQRDMCKTHVSSKKGCNHNWCKGAPSFELAGRSRSLQKTLLQDA